MNVIEKAKYGLPEPVSNCLAWLDFSLLPSNSGLDNYCINSYFFYLCSYYFLILKRNKYS